MTTVVHRILSELGARLNATADAFRHAAPVTTQGATIEQVSFGPGVQRAHHPSRPPEAKAGLSDERKVDGQRDPQPHTVQVDEDNDD